MPNPAEPSAIRRIAVAARAGLVAGAWLGVALAVATASGNGFDRFGDALRVHAALVAVFGLLLGGCGLATGIVLLPVRRLRHRAGEAGFAPATAVTAAVLAARWFELRHAYPSRFPMVHDYGDMLAVACVFLAAVTAAAVGLAAVVFRVAVAARRNGVTAPRCAAAAGVVAVIAAGVIGLRPGTAGSSRATDGGPPVAGPLTAPEPLPVVVPAHSDRRVLLVGCDGADGAVIDTLLAEGELPNLAAMIRDGVRAPLRTIRDRPSPSLWTSVACSRTPEDTGIRDFYVQEVLGARRPVAEFPELLGLNHGLLLRDVLGPAAVRVVPVNSTMVRTRPFWSVLAAAGVRVGVVNWLVTWPAHAEGAAFLVSDQAWTERGEAADGSGTAAAGADGDARRALWDPPEIGATLPDDAAARETEDSFVVETALRLRAEYRPQVLVAYFRDVDAAEHLSWNEWEPRFFPGGAGKTPHGGPVREAYLRFDRALGELRTAMGDDATTIVVSDHGHHAWFTWLGRGTPGGHTDSPDGILVAAGSGIRGGTQPIEPSLYDIAPTVMRLVGVPTAADMEGRPLQEILEDAAPLPVVATWESGRRGTAPAGGEDEEVLERLRTLGYIR